MANTPFGTVTHRCPPSRRIAVAGFPSTHTRVGVHDARSVGKGMAVGTSDEPRKRMRNSADVPSRITSSSDAHSESHAGPGNRRVRSSFKISSLGSSCAAAGDLLDLTLLAPDIQALILELQAADSVEPMSERTLRDAVHAEDWARQCEGLPFREWRDQEAGPLAAHSVRANASSGARQSHPSRALGLKGPMSTLVHSNPLVGQSASVAHGRWHPSHAQKGEP